MDAVTTSELERLARDAAKEIAGEHAVQEVEVTAGERLERPVYFFSYLFDRDRSKLRPGLVIIRLLQRLGDELDERSDEHRPVIQLLDRADWARHRSA